METFESKANVKTVNGQAPDSGGNVDVGFGNINEVLPLEKGGTGKTTAAAVRMVLGLGNTTNALPIANGGTGASTVENARKNLGINEIAVSMIDFVTEQQNYTDSWYRLWKSTFCEQGGTTTIFKNKIEVTILLLKPFPDTNYIVLITPQISGNIDTLSIPRIVSKEKDRFTFTAISQTGETSGKLMWYAFGNRSNWSE